MTKISSSLLWFLLFVLTLFLQLSFIMADSKNTASKVTIEFAKAYFLADPVMNKYLCEDLRKKEVVAEHLKNIQVQSSNLGYELYSLRKSIFHINTQTTYINETTATVKLTAKSKAYINPLYKWISQIFKIGNTYSVNEVFSLIQENKKWKISSYPSN